MQVIEQVELAGGKVVATIFEAATSSDPDRVRLIIESGGTKASRFFKGEMSHLDAMRYAEDIALSI